MKRTAVLSILVVVVLLVLGVIAEAQQPSKIHRIGLLLARPLRSMRPGSRHFVKVCASWATWKERTFRLSTDMQKAS